MLYALICTDEPGALPVRKANRPLHLEYLKSLGDTVVLAGHSTEEDGAHERQPDRGGGRLA
jgi:uncharacterized protein YciI